MTKKDTDNIVPKMHSPAFLEAERKLMDMFMRNGVNVNSPLRESLLAKEFNIKRCAMREALCQAVGWGIVEYVSFCGFRIRDFTLADITDCLELRDAIESASARKLATTRPAKVIKALSELLDQANEARRQQDHARFNLMDILFHLDIIRNCGNRKFASPAIISYITVVMTLNNKELNEVTFSRLPLEIDPMTPKDISFAEYIDYSEEQCCFRHRDLLCAIEEGDAYNAERQVHAHLRGTLRRFAALMQMYSPDTPLSTIFSNQNNRKSVNHPKAKATTMRKAK